MDINEDVPEEELQAEISTCEYVCNIMTHPFLPDDILTSVISSESMRTIKFISFIFSYTFFICALSRLDHDKDSCNSNLLQSDTIPLVNLSTTKLIRI